MHDMRGAGLYLTRCQADRGYSVSELKQQTDQVYLIKTFDEIRKCERDLT